MALSIRLLCVLTSVLLVAGCAHGNVFELLNPKSNQATFCDVMNKRGGPIRWNPNDTRITKEQVDEINRAGVRLCGWGKK